MAKEKLREILGLDKNVMTEGDFVDAFENVVDILRDAKEVTEQEIEDLKALIKETVATLKQDSKETAESIDAKMVNVLNREVEKIETRIGVKLKEIDKKLATIKDGKDADEARVVATVLAQVPKYKMDTSEDIRNKLELLKDEDRLDKSAIRGLDNVVDEPTLNRAIEILDKRTQFLINKPSSTGGGTSVTLAGEDYLSLSGQEITANPIDIDNLSATGTPDNSTFLRGDGTWATPTGSGITLQVEGVNNTDQSLLNLVAGSNMTITDNEDGSVTFDATGGSGSPGGSDTQLQFNDDGDFGGIPEITWDKTNEVLNINASNDNSYLLLESMNTAEDAGSSLYVPSNGGLEFASSIGTLNLYNWSNNAILDFSDIAGSDKTFTFPNTTGTLALTSDIPAAGANTALSNLASVAINTSLISDTDNTDDLGSASVGWRTGYFSTSVLTPTVTADTSAGILLESANGTDIGLLGAGNTANVTWYGAHNFDTATQDTIAAFTGSGKTLGSLATSTYPSLTELSYVKGVTSSIQTQLNAKGAGTVTSVGASVPTGLTITGSPVTTTGTLAIALDTGYVIPLQTTLDGKASTTLNNLGTTAINTSLISDTNNTDDLGSTGVRWKKTWTVDLESTNMPTVGGTSLSSVTQTFTNKRITKRTGTTTSSATPTINTDDVDEYYITAQAADITSFTTNLSGTPTLGQLLFISIIGTAARAITWGASFANGPVALPTTTVTTTQLSVLLKWDGSIWRCYASGSTV